MNILDNFGIQPILLAAQAVNFLVLLYILQRFLYRPILKVLNERRQRIADSIKNAEEIDARLLKTEEDREKKLAQATTEARQIIDEAGKNAAQIIEEAHQKATADIQAMIDKNNQAMALEREQLRQEIRQEAADLVVLGLAKVTGKVLTKPDQKKLVERSVKELL